MIEALAAPAEPPLKGRKFLPIQSNPIFIQNCPHYERLHLNVAHLYLNDLAASWVCKKPSKTSGRKKLQYDGDDDSRKKRGS